LHQIYEINADGTGNVKIIDAQIGLNHHNWSPDASRIAAVGYHNNFSTWSIYIFNADGTGLTRLTNMNNVWDSEPTFSPTGIEIAFSRVTPNQTSHSELWIMNSDGTNQRYINVMGFLAKWSPDGTKFIYTSDKSGNSEIYTCNVDGTDETKITTTDGDEANPIWCPDGQHILFSRSDDKTMTGYEIYRMKIDGTELTRLTNNNSYDGYPRLSPDGTQIAFHSDLPSPEHYEVYIMNADGTNIRRLTNNSANITAINPDWRPVR
jgi:TolB protein